MAVKTLDEAGSPFYYSTRGEEQKVVLHHGMRISGGMDAQQLTDFCREKHIQLIVDAGHPFAEQLHQTVADVAKDLQLPAIRVERIFSPHTPDITWCANYDAAREALISAGVKRLLALTGVQTVGKLKSLADKGVECFYRILQRQSSMDIAHRQGINDEHLCFYQMGDGDR